MLHSNHKGYEVIRVINPDVPEHKQITIMLRGKNISDGQVSSQWSIETSWTSMKVPDTASVMLDGTFYSNSYVPTRSHTEHSMHPSYKMSINVQLNSMH